MKKRFYITTPIYYASGNAHIGHAYCTTMCDIFARYKRLRGFETYFLTGMDEHGQKVKEVALKNNVTPQEYVDMTANKFLDLWKLMDISNDGFIRTTNPQHVKTVQHVFTKMLDKGDIYLGSYEGWYCTPCESFWTETQLNGNYVCPDCGRPVQKATEESYFFKCKKYVDDVLKLYNENPHFCYPESRKNEMINTFIKPGLNDLSVTRTSTDWGVPVLENNRHVMYVWLDALTNYISALGYNSEDDSLFKKFWEDPESEIIHVLGSEISRFHAIYWPMFLTSLGLRLPDREFVHGLIMMKDGKMSKSKGNVISPYPLVEKYGVDAVRYYLAREVVFGHEGQFTPEQFVERINMDLVNNLGNLLNRTVSMMAKYFDGVIPSYIEPINTQDKEIDDMINDTISQYEDNLDDLRITEAFIKVMELLSRGNKYIEETTPWTLAKEESTQNNLKSVMFRLSNILYVSAIMLKPVLIFKSDELLDQLGIDGEKRDYKFIKLFKEFNNIQTVKKEPLFPRLDETVEIEYVKSLLVSK